MDLNVIRSMNDDELNKFLRGLTQKHSTSCMKCGKSNANYVINIQNKAKLQQKKLCSLCDDCYQDLLKKLETSDIMWD